MKKIMFLVVLTIISVNSTFAYVIGVSSQPIAVTLSAPNQVPLGSTVEVNVNVPEVTSLDTASFGISFDPLVLQFSEIQVGTLMSGASLLHDSPMPGKINAVLNLPDSDGVTGSGAIATLKFRAIKQLTYSDLILSAVVLGDADANPIVAEAGEPERVTVLGVSEDVVTVNVDAPAEVDEGGTLTANVVVTQVTDLDTASFTLRFDPTMLEITDVSAGELITGANLTFNASTPGSVDVVINVQGLTGVSGEGTIATISFDVTGIPGDSCQLTLLNDLILGNTVSKQIPSVVGAAADVSVSGTPPDAVGVNLTTPESVQPTSQFTAHISLSHVSELDTTSFCLNYDEDQFLIRDVLTGSLTAKAVPLYNIDEGSIAIVVNQPDLNGATGTGIIASVVFRAIGDAGSVGNLQLDDVLLGDTSAQRIPCIVASRAPVNINTASDPSAIIDLVLPQVVVDVDGTFSAKITTTEVNNLDTISLVLAFDPDIVEYSSASGSGLLAGVTPSVNDTIAGQVNIVLNVDDLSGVSGSGELADVEFHALGDTGTYTELKLSGVVLGNVDTAIIPSYTDRYEVTAYIGIMKGDVSGNEMITAYDAALVFQHISGLIQLSQEQIDRGDMNGDGALTAVDAKLILQKVVGLN